MEVMQVLKYLPGALELNYSSEPNRCPVLRYDISNQGVGRGDNTNPKLLRGDAQETCQRSPKP